MEPKGLNRMDWVGLLVQIIVSVILVAPVLWLAGRWLAGKDKAKFTDAIWIVVLGVVIGTILQYYLTGWLTWLAAVLVFFIWLGLIKHFFDCGWLKAFAIAIVAMIIYVILAAIFGAILTLL